MIIDEKKGPWYKCLDDCDVFSKEEVKEMMSNNFKDFEYEGDNKITYKNFVAASLIENKHAIMVEDYKGSITIMNTGKLQRRGVEVASLLELKEIDFDVEVTTPHDDSLFIIVDKNE